MPEYTVRVGSDERTSEMRVWIDNPSRVVWWGQAVTDVVAAGEGDVSVTILDGDLAGKTARAELMVH